MYELFEKIDDLVKVFLEEEATKVTAEEIGLDRRAAHRLFVTHNAIIVHKKHDASLQYYGGFEYVDKECRKEVGDYVFYTDDDDRVRRHLSYAKTGEYANQDDEEE